MFFYGQSNDFKWLDFGTGFAGLKIKERKVVFYLALNLRVFGTGLIGLKATLTAPTVLNTLFFYEG